MASLRKDSAINRAALARRRQRVAPTTTAGKVQFSASPEEDSSSSKAPPPLSPARSSVLERSLEVSEEVASVMASVRKKSSLERSMEVAEEAASVLASVQQQQGARRQRQVEPSVRRPEETAAAAKEELMQKRQALARQEGDSSATRQSPSRQETTGRQQAPPAPPPPVRRITQHTATALSPEPSSRHAKEEEEELIRSATKIHLSDDENDDGDDDLPPTIEDLEPRVEDPVTDAACLPDESLVMLRSNANLRTLVLDGGERNCQLGCMGGFGLGRGHELWQLTILKSRQKSAGGEKVLCYGDKIALHMGSSSVLSVQKRESSFQVGFFGSSADAQWVVLRAKPPHAVLLGTHPRKVEEHPTGPIQMGDPVVLRHVAIGGVLAVQEDGALRLVTDSYDSNRIRHDEDYDGTLLGRLQRQNRLVPAVTETFHWLPSNVPPTPLWIGKRPFVQGSHHLLSLQEKPDIEGGGRKYSDQMKKPYAQEQVLLDEILGSFLGLKGNVIQVQRATSVGVQSLSFSLTDPRGGPVFDPILRRLVEAMLPLSTAYIRVSHFVATRIMPGYQYGCVMHAFCERLDALLQDYLKFVASLESSYRREDQSSLCRLQVQIQATLNAMMVMERAIEVVASKKGGAMLNSLRTLKREIYEGDSMAGVILEQLLEAAAGPYLQILREWLECGVLIDPYLEFMVQRRNSADKEYEIAEEHVLEGFFSTKVTVEKVLATGRFWNSLQACSVVVDQKEQVQPMILHYSESSSTVASFVESNYKTASRALVDLVLDTFDLVGSLRLMKRYFLLDHGDFFIYFLDAAEDELRKDLPSVSRGRIQHWLDASIQRTERSMDEAAPVQNRQNAQQMTPLDLLCRFAPESLADHLDELHAESGGIDTHEPWTPQRHAYGDTSSSASEHLTGLDAFMVDFPTIPFPLSLILSPKAVDCYQLLFRHLFFAKHVERRLVGIWQDHQGMKELQSLRKMMGPTFLLRQRMLHFLQNLIYYMMLEVIEPKWSEMEGAISFSRENQTIDDISKHHMQFLHQALEACLLTNRDLVRSLTKLMKTCLLFSDQMKLFMQATKIEDDRKGVANEKRKVVQRNLNDRRGSMQRLSIDRDVLQESIKISRLERKERIQRQTLRVEREIQGESYPRMIARFDQVFSNNLREFMAQLTHSDDLYHTQKVNLCIRLDYNGYVTRAMGLTPNL